MKHNITISMSFRPNNERFVVCVLDINADFQLEVQNVVNVIFQVISNDSLQDSNGNTFPSE